MTAPFDVTGVVLETPRLLLRPWSLADLEDFYAYASADGAGQMAGWSPHRSREESLEILKLFIREKKIFALVSRESGRVIGSLGLEVPETVPEEARPLLGREIGYVLRKEDWGRGLMPEAVRYVIDYCFQTLGYDWLTCAHFLWNRQSKRVIEKCGLRYFGDGVFLTRFQTQEATRNYIIYAPNREEHYV